MATTMYTADSVMLMVEAITENAMTSKEAQDYRGYLFRFAATGKRSNANVTITRDDVATQTPEYVRIMKEMRETNAWIEELLEQSAEAKASASVIPGTLLDVFTREEEDDSALRSAAQ